MAETATETQRLTGIFQGSVCLEVAARWSHTEHSARVSLPLWVLLSRTLCSYDDDRSDSESPRFSAFSGRGEVLLLLVLLSTEEG